MLATRISFINEMANLCDLSSELMLITSEEGLEVIHGYGNKFLYPGSGYGRVPAFLRMWKAIIRNSKAILVMN
jgi:UDP-glucose 6-dehydrogenase